MEKETTITLLKVCGVTAAVLAAGSGGFLYGFSECKKVFKKNLDAAEPLIIDVMNRVENKSREFDVSEEELNAYIDEQWKFVLSVIREG